MRLRLRIALAAAGLGLALGTAYAVKAGPAGVALAAKHLCSLVHVGGLDPGLARRAYVEPFVWPLGELLRLDWSPHGLTASAGGAWSSRALHRPGAGCTLVHGNALLQALTLPPIPAQPGWPEPGGDAGFDPAALAAALDEAFRDPEPGSPRHTMAVVVLHRGRLAAERYAPGVTDATPLPGWSMTKSVTAALAGILVREGRLDPDAPGAVSRWRGSDDPRAAISMDQLLRMTAGLDITEDQSGLDPNTRMLFRVPDAAAFAAARTLRAEPGRRYEYMSGSTVLASRRIRELAGGSARATLAFARRELFGPLGMTTAVLEPDQAGTPIGSSFMLASARDWARFGQLHLDDGVWRGRRMLPEGWVAYVTRHTPASGAHNYGAGWWINAAPEGPRWPSLPRDTYAASGFQHQTIFVVPSRRLVIVRLGATRGDRSHVERLAAGVIAAQR